MKEYNFYVYIIANSRRTTFYTGITSNLKRRLLEHLDESINVNSFCKKYKCKSIIYFEHYDYVDNALVREKQIKRWSRKKKLDLIKLKNPMLNSFNYEILRAND